MSTAALVLMAAISDATGSTELAFYALLGAVPTTAACGLSVFGDVLEHDGRVAQACVWALVLTLVVAGAATRSPALLAGGVPDVGATALTACLALLSLEGVLAAVAEFRRHATRPG